MGHVVDGRVNGAPFAGIVLTAGSVLRADDAAAPCSPKRWRTHPSPVGTPSTEAKRPRTTSSRSSASVRRVWFWSMPADMALPVGSIRLLDKRDVARKSMFTTHSLPLSILIEEIEQSCEDIVFVGIQPGDTEFYNPCPRRSLTPSTPCTTPWPPTTFPTLSAWGKSNRSACPC